MGEITTFSSFRRICPSVSKVFLTPNIPSPSTAISIPLKFSISSCFRTSSTPTSFQISSKSKTIIPARDRVIDLGKYKGKMLGSLPSNYLKWVSKNLRAGDTEEWAKLADEVLIDPVYRDRMEWELAEKILNGNAASPNSSGNGGNAVSELLEISERFGWDNEDKVGWSKIDFGLLGTSKGGRIPRLGKKSVVEVGRVKNKKEEEKNEVEGRRRRRERRERMRQRRVVVSGGDRDTDTDRERETVGRRVEEMMNVNGEGEERKDGVVGSPFPGREALLRKVLNRRTL